MAVGPMKLLANVLVSIGWLMIIVGCFAVYSYWSCATRLSSLYSNYNSTYFPLIGEEDVFQNPIKLAERMIEEANTMWKDGQWVLETDSGSGDVLKVESRPISGQFEQRRIPVQRAFGLLNNSNPRELFNFMTSPEGFAVIDPITPIEEHRKPPLHSFPWKKGRLEIVSAKIDFPWPFHRREFIVFNVFDETTLTFVSKSCQYDYDVIASAGKDPSVTADPDAPAPDPRPPTVRAINTFAIKFELHSSGNSDQCLASFPDTAAAAAGGGGGRGGGDDTAENTNPFLSSVQNGLSGLIGSIKGKDKKENKEKLSVQGPGPAECTVWVSAVNYADLHLDRAITHWINVKGFFAPLYQRMEVGFASHAASLATAPPK